MIDRHLAATMHFAKLCNICKFSKSCEKNGKYTLSSVELSYVEVDIYIHNSFTQGSCAVMEAVNALTPLKIDPYSWLPNAKSGISMSAQRRNLPQVSGSVVPSDH
jgi:hypothetical protein